MQIKLAIFQCSKMMTQSKGQGKLQETPQVLLNYGLDLILTDNNYIGLPYNYLPLICI